MELCLYLFIGTVFGNSRVVLPNHLSIYTSDEFGNGVKIGKINPYCIIIMIIINIIIKTVITPLSIWGLLDLFMCVMSIQQNMRSSSICLTQFDLAEHGIGDRDLTISDLNHEESLDIVVAELGTILQPLKDDERCHSARQMPYLPEILGCGSQSQADVFCEALCRPFCDGCMTP